MEKKVNKKVGKKVPNKKFNGNKQGEKLDRNGEVIVPCFRVKIAEQLCATPAKLAMLIPVLQKYDLAIASYA